MTSPQYRGSVFGGTLLVAGSCIGAGMLALPILTGLAGFTPSLLLFLICWLFMMTTGLLLLEVNIWLGGKVGLVTMAGRTLGKRGKVVTWLTFLFLFYCLNVAYIDAGGRLVADFFSSLTGNHLPLWGGELVVVLFFGAVVYLGTAVVDGINRILVIGLAAAYFSLIALGTPHLSSHYLAYHNWHFALAGIPIIITSFGFHNMIPSLAQYLHAEKRRLIAVVAIGSIIPLVIYIVWELLILGIVPPEGPLFATAASEGLSATELLRTISKNGWVTTVAEYFAFFAITTSFLTQSLSFVGFLADGTKIKRKGMGHVFLCLLALAPGFIFTLSYPNLFLTALGFAGGFGAMILFGIIPALMVWKKRKAENDKKSRIVPGGPLLLIAVVVFAAFVFLLQLGYLLGWLQ
ncbi:tyrosine transporter [Simkania negevensis]|uniref:Tyrosine transporter n=1 Tax=Simkania negevensis TaxID=83561 RepID=A0ABS3AS44_9BACT|nr:tyrosine transporter [Simkania negevensis]